MYCEICGKEVKEAFLIQLGRSKLRVCESCKKLGNEIKQEIPKKQNIIKQQTKKIEIKRKEPEINIREDYASVIRKARESLGMTQDMLASLIGEKLSTFKKIESGKLKPTIETAKKLEKVLKISLLETQKFEERIEATAKKLGLTLGDIVEIEED